MTIEESELDVIEAANDLSSLLEAGGLQHPKHAVILEPIYAKVKALMRKYFRLQKKAVLESVAPHIRHQLVIRRTTAKEALTPPPEAQSARHAANAIVPETLDPLLFSATANQSRIYDSLVQKAFEEAAAQIAAEYGTDAALEDDAVATYLRDNSLSKLTGGLAQTSIERLQTAIADAYIKGGGYDEIVQAIKDEYDGFSTSRAVLIAQTETNSAYNQGRYEMASTLGYNQKRWATDLTPCIVCELNALTGWVDLADSFPSGDESPLAHPGCFCELDFRLVTPGH